MTAAVVQNFTTYAGNDVAPVITVKDTANAIVDISSVSEIAFVARRNLGSDPVISKSKTGGGITFVTDGTDGKFKVLITAANTTALSGAYLFAATITLAGNVVTVTTGTMNVGLAPAWTYDPSLIGTVDLYTVRRLIGDVIAGDQQLVDAEVLWAISQYSNVYLAAAECARQISAQVARQVDLVQGELKTNYSQRARAYATMAASLEQRGMARGGAMPYAGGISRTDKSSVESDGDRVQPQYNIGMQDNLTMPGGKDWNETPGAPALPGTMDGS